MTRWLLAAIIGLVIAALHYGLPGLRRGDGSAPSAALPASLRWLAATLIAALLLGAAVGRARPLPPLVALDGSASWTRGGISGARWPEALALARASAPDSVYLFGDSLRALRASDALPADTRSSARAALERARDEGRALLVVSDGESADLGALPAGARVRVLRRAPVADVAVAAIQAPERAIPGDTIEVGVTVRAGERVPAGATVSVGFEGGAFVTRPAESLPPLADRALTVRVVVPAGERERALRAIVTMAGDAEPRNDTLATIVEVTRAPAAVLVSTSPDPDARAALEALSGALTVAPRGYYRVAPGAWRDAASLAPVAESAVRDAMARASLLVLHGDTALFGAPMALGRGALVLMIPGEAGDEWRARPGEVTPLSPSLAGIPWDSTPPIDLPVAAPHGDWTALVAGATVGGGTRAVVTGGEAGGRRRVVVAASGIWRWRARGGASRQGYDALWGAIADWTTARPGDVRPTLPARRWARAGERIDWRRTGGDSTVAVVLRDDAGHERTIGLAFAADARDAQSAALPPGRWTAAMRGGSAAFIVNASAELLPTRATLRDTSVAGAAPGVPPAPLRDHWWAYALPLLALCGEWILRRRSGLR
ncbi:MAG TPA: hypothetical protein VF761_07400 [Gemmatimonadaceae bacterium]